MRAPRFTTRRATRREPLDDFEWPDLQFNLRDPTKRLDGGAWRPWSAPILPRRKSASPAWDAVRALRERL